MSLCLCGESLRAPFLWVAALAFLAAIPAGAHVPALSGKLVSLARQSDLIVIATVEQVRDVGPRRIDTTVVIERVLGGEMTGKTLTYGGGPRLVAAQRYVVFLRRSDTGFVCAQDAGVVFPASPRDDELYARTITAVRAAPGGDGRAQVHGLRAALIPALQAAAAALRFHAALELAALAHHAELTAVERRDLERIAADPATDATVRPLVATLLAPGRPPP